MTEGRNDPCPCGSGRKYKKCHLAADAAERLAGRTGEASPLHELDHRLVEQIVDFADRRFTGQVLGEADALDTHPDMSPQFAMPWLAYIAEYDGRTAADWFAEERAWSLSRGAAEWLAAQQKSWLSVWAVLEVDPGRGMALNDELTGERRNVHEVAASRAVMPHMMLLGRVVDHAGISIIAGMHPVPLPPAEGLEVVERITRFLRRKTAVRPERLRDYKVARRMLMAWSDAVDRRRTLPVLTNTQGDAILFTFDRWQIASGRREEVAAALATIEGAVVEDDDSLVFLRGETVIGAARIESRTVTIETNSTARADALRERVEASCKGLLGRWVRSHSDPLTAVARPAPEELPTEEEAAVIRQLKDLHYSTWPDEPLPALGGLTPREAVRHKAGRRRVQKLLQQIEMMEAIGEEATRFDISRLRQELGL